MTDHRTRARRRGVSLVLITAAAAFTAACGAQESATPADDGEEPAAETASASEATESKTVLSVPGMT